MPGWIIFCIGLPIFVLFSSYQRRLTHKRTSKGLPYPPGPKPFPFLGNLFDVPQAAAWLTYTDWRRTYGDIIHVQVLQQHVVVINSVEIAFELLDKRSRHYSDRPIIPVIELFGWEWMTAMMPYSEEWKIHRKLFHQCFRSQVSLSYRPIQLKKIHGYMRDLLESPQDFIALTHSLSAQIIMKCVYDYDTASKNDRLVEMAETAVHMVLDAIIPGASIINVIPILAKVPGWFPGASFQRMSGTCKKLTQEMQDAPLKFLKNGKDAGTANKCAVSELLENDELKRPFDEQEKSIKAVAATTYAAGSDTTTSSNLSAILACILYPEAAQKAQAEIDRVVGPTRLPNYEDRPHLPYLEAFYREVMRWHPAVPCAVPHASTKDDFYDGYYIPKGSVVMGNIWAMTHDERKYPQPNNFNPERFFTAEGKLNNDSTILAFGFGRRICSGQYLADATVWATIASLLAVFDIKKEKDPQGNEIDVQEIYTNALISCSQPFQCSIRPRSEEVRQLVLDAVQDV